MKDYKIIKHGQKARQSLKRGIDAVANAVKITLGPRGRNVIIGSKFSNLTITNDGVSIAKQVVLEDEIENLGAEALKDVSSRTNDEAGDGTTTATVLAQAIIQEMFNRLDDPHNLVKSQSNPMAIKREIDSACDIVLHELDKRAKKIKSKSELEAIATASVEDKEMGKQIAHIIDKVGKHGVVIVEDGSEPGIKTDIIEGMEIDFGLAVKRLDEDKVMVETPHILLINGPVDNLNQISGIINALSEGNIYKLVIIAQDFEESILSTFLINKARAAFDVTPIRLPNIAKSGIMEDLSVLLDAKIFDSKSGDNPENATLQDLGKCGKIIATDDKTKFIGGVGDTKAYIKKLQTEEVKGSFEKDKMEKRIAKLSNGVGVIKVGANSELEQSYLRDKLDDAVAATRAAVDEGVVPGGGLALKQISETLDTNILTEALLAPYKQIQENAGGQLEVSEDVLDPVKVTKSAIKNACSLAGIIITTEVAIEDKNEERKT